MSACQACGLALGTEFDNKSCPNCGKTPSDAQVGNLRSETSLALVRGYFSDLFNVIAHPILFFRQMPLSGGLSGPLAFALITHWLGSALGFISGGLSGGGFSRYFGKILEIGSDFDGIDSPGRSLFLPRIMEARDHVTTWLWGTGGVILDPFLTLISLIFTGFFVYLGARILVTPGKNLAPREITYESTLRILCFATAPAIFGVVPFIGGFASTIAVTIWAIIGVKEVYRVSIPRAVAVALFPKLLLIGMALSAFFFVVLAVMKFFAFLG